MVFDGGKVLAVTHLKRALIEQLEMALEMLARVGDEAYSGARDVRGCIGAHIRHNINFVDAIIDGAITGSVDYAVRTRDRLIENDRAYASAKLRSLIESLARIPIHLSEPVAVISELNPRLIVQSTFGRELEFAISHTVHHYALIRERLEQSGIQFDPRFGVALSTLEYWETAGR